MRIHRQAIDKAVNKLVRTIVKVIGREQGNAEGRRGKREACAARRRLGLARVPGQTAPLQHYAAGRRRPRRHQPQRTPQRP